MCLREDPALIMHSIFHHRSQVSDLSSDDWLNTFAEGGFSAVIFDCDGTLVESSRAHLSCMQAAAEEQGHKMSKDWYSVRTGLDRHSLFREFGESRDAAFDVERACQASIERYGDFARLVRPIPETIKFAKALRRQNVPLAVATNAERPVAELSLSTAHARHLFDLIVSLTDNIPPKPSPLMFELAAEKLDVPRAKALIVEDSPEGVRAAKETCMSVIQIVHEHSM